MNDKRSGVIRELRARCVVHHQIPRLTSARTSGLSCLASCESPPSRLNPKNKSSICFEAEVVGRVPACVAAAGAEKKHCFLGCWLRGVQHRGRTAQLP